MNNTRRPSPDPRKQQPRSILAPQSTMQPPIPREIMLEVISATERNDIPPLSPNDVLALQHLVGNYATRSLIRPPFDNVRTSRERILGDIQKILDQPDKKDVGDENESELATVEAGTRDENLADLSGEKEVASESSEDQQADLFATAPRITRGSKFGAGGQGAVFEVLEDDSQLFKPAVKPQNPGLAVQYSELNWQEGPMRAVATRKLDQLIGTGVTGKAELAVDQDNQKGHTMAKAPGKRLADLSTEEKAILYDNPTAKRGLYNLQTLDYLTGEVDRHPENIMVDQTSGQITGIDNETAFNAVRPTKEIHKKLTENKIALANWVAKKGGYTQFLTEGDSKPGTTGESGPKFKDFKDPNLRRKLDIARQTDGVWNVGMPEYMDERVAQTLARLTESDFEDAVKGLLPADAIKVLTINFKKLKKEALRRLEQFKDNPAGSKIIPDEGWDRVQHTPAGDNYFYP